MDLDEWWLMNECKVTMKEWSGWMMNDEWINEWM